MPFHRRLLPTVFVVLAGCFNDVSLSHNDVTGTYVPQRSVDITPLNGSGIVGTVSIFLWDLPAPRIRASIAFPELGPRGAGVRYPTHIHQGRECGGRDVAITHDLGAPVASYDQSYMYPGASIDTMLPREHLLSGYYLDVHAENDANGVAVGCVVFPW